MRKEKGKRFMLAGVLLMNLRMAGQVGAYDVTASKTSFTSTSTREGESK